MSAAREIEIAEKVVRALAILVNTGAVYDSDHPVFLRAVDERFSVFEDAVRKLGKIKMAFQGGQITVRQSTLDPGADMFEKLARRMESKGIQGLILKKGLRKEDVIKFIREIKGIANYRKVQDLRKIFADHSIRGIEVFTPQAKGGEEAGDTSQAGKGGVKAANRTFELDDLADEQVTSGESEWETAYITSATGIFKGYVSDVLGKVEDRQITAKDAADSIATEFENQLTSQVTEYKNQTESHIRRLENIKDLVLDELESLELAAIVVDPGLKIIAMNRSGRELLGKVSQIGSKDPIARFLRSGSDRGQIIVGGRELTAHLVISESSHSSEGAMLICLE